MGDPASEILKAVDAIGADMVIMAVHGMKARFPFGGVAEKVIKNSRVPVFAISPNSRL